MNHFLNDRNAFTVDDVTITAHHLHRRAVAIDVPHIDVPVVAARRDIVVVEEGDFLINVLFKKGFKKSRT